MQECPRKIEPNGIPEPIFYDLNISVLSYLLLYLFYLIEYASDE